MSLKKCAWICIGLAMIETACNSTITPASMPTINPTITPASIPAINPSATPDLAAQAWQELKLGKVPGVDLGMSGERYGLPESVLAELGQMGGAAVVGVGSIIGAKDASGCSLILPDHLVTGEKVKQATDGVVEYGFDGQIGTESIWKIPVGEGVNCVAFVAKDGNKWGLRSGTVAAWFYQDGGKAGSTVLNPDTPLRIMYDAANQAQLTSLEDSGVSLTVSDQNGTVIDNQEVTLAPEAIQFPIINKLDLEKFQELPYVSAEDAVSDKFDRFIMDSYQKGLIGDFPEHAEPFAPASLEKEMGFYDPATYIGPMWLLPSELKHTGRYTDLSIRPDFIAKAFFKTEINGKDYVLLVQIWKNPDASIAFIKYVHSPETFKLILPGDPTFDYLAFLGVNAPNPVVLTVPWLYSVGKRPDFAKVRIFDENYYDNYWLPNFPEIEALRQQVNKNGNIPPEISRFLMYLGVNRISLADIP